MKGGRLMLAVAALAVGVASVPALNWAGGTLAAVLGLPVGGNARLAWDLVWLLLSVMAAVWLPARWSPLWPRALALCLAALLMGGLCWAAWRLGGDFPRWFVAALLMGVPVAAGAGWVLARRGLRTA